MAPQAQGPVPPLVLISGPEQVTAERAVKSVVEAVRESEPDAELVRIHHEGYDPGSLGLQTAPSLFGGAKVVVVEGFDQAPEALVADAEQAVAMPAEGITLVVRHKGGNRAKRVLDAMKKGGARVIQCPAIKSDADKSSFVQNEFRTARRRIEAPAVAALVRAVGSDVRELESACAQLVADTEGVITEQVVGTYYGGKVETTGFKVAEAAIAGDTHEAMRLLRHALIGGVNPVPIVAVLASQLRNVGRVASAGRAPAGALAKQLGMAPWQIDQARRAARGWDGDRLGRAIQAVAAADVETKGGLRSGAASRDQEYAVERAVLEVCRLREG